MQALGLVWDTVDPLTADLNETATRIPEPVHFGAKLLLARWRELQAGDGFVVGRDVPSRPLGGVLRNLGIYEPLDDCRDFRARLAGTAFMRRFGRDITGLKLSEIFQAEGFERHCANLAEIVRLGVPLSFDVRLHRGKQTFLHCEALRLPVLSPDRSNRWVLSGLFYYD
jgi:hypothetical protein